jgi:hypothetical protein
MDEEFETHNGAKMKNSVLFVGEQRSPTAIRMGVTWLDRRLAAKQLFDAFDTLGVDPAQFRFCNVRETKAEAVIGEAVAEGIPIVGMGRIVQGELRRMGVSYHAMVHPAARGKIRQKSVYTAHVATVMQKLEDETKKEMD